MARVAPPEALGALGTELTQTGRTVVFVSHNFENVRSFCDRVAWLEDGFIKALGTPEEVLDDAASAIAAGRAGVSV